MVTSTLRIGIDLGGTGTRIALVTPEGDAVDHVAFATSTDPARAVPDLVEAVRRLVSDHPLTSIGIGASGPVDRDGVIRNPETLPAFTGVDVRAALSSSFDAPVSIDNDAVAAAVYEARVGEAVGAPGLLMITLGTGVGVAALTEGRPVRGADGEHPEAGHRYVSGPDAPCYCGRSACWEQVVSRAALQRAAVDLLPAELDPISALTEAARRARADDPAALAVFTAFGRRLGEGLVDLETTLRSDVIVIGGSAAAYGDLLIYAVQSVFAAVDVYRKTPRLTFSRTGDLGGAIGAALLDPHWY